MADDVVFTFDEKPFINGIRAAIKEMGALEKRSDETTQGILKSVTGVVARLAVMKVAFQGIRSAIAEIPEIGQAFNIAKDIILKNFLFPIRQAVLPVLQNILDWVRDNRSAFVRWGGIVVNIFRTAATVARQLFDAIRTIGRAVGGLIRDVFGLPETFEQSVNVILFKISALSIFVGNLLRPVSDAIARVIEQLTPFVQRLRDVVMQVVEISVQLATAFGEGLLRGLEGVREPINRIRDALIRIGQTIIENTGGIEGWRNAFERLGELVGTALTLAFQGLAFIVEGIAAGIEAMARTVREDLIPFFRDLFTREEGEPGFFGRLFGRNREEEIEESVQRSQQGSSPPTPQRDQRVDPRFQHLQSAENQKRAGRVSRAGGDAASILAGQPGTGGNTTINNSVTIPGMTLNVTEGNAEQAGRNFAAGINVAVTDEVTRDQLRAGV